MIRDRGSNFTAVFDASSPTPASGPCSATSKPRMNAIIVRKHSRTGGLINEYRLVA